MMILKIDLNLIKKEIYAIFSEFLMVTSKLSFLLTYMMVKRERRHSRCVDVTFEISKINDKKLNKQSRKIQKTRAERAKTCS